MIHLFDLFTCLLFGQKNMAVPIILCTTTRTRAGQVIRAGQVKEGYEGHVQIIAKTNLLNIYIHLVFCQVLVNT